MKVIATQTGYFGKLRQPGDEFEVPNGSKASWFSPVVKAGPKGKKVDGGDAPDGGSPEGGPPEGGDAPDELM